MDEFHRTHENIELVWTGPNPINSPYRQTYQALIDLIRSASNSILIVTFVAYKIPEIALALLDAAKRGIKIKFIIESPQESESKVTLNALEAIGEELVKMSEIYVWPLEYRPINSAGNHGSLHAKCAVADDTKALLSSANLTSFAMDLNMEIGLLITGGHIPKQITKHFSKLIEMGWLVKIP